MHVIAAGSAELVGPQLRSDEGEEAGERKEQCTTANRRRGVEDRLSFSPHKRYSIPGED